MTIHRAAVVLLVSLASVMLLTACDDDHRGFRAKVLVTGPTPFDRRAPFGGPGIGAVIFPTTIGFTTVSIARCPEIAPFFSTVSLVIDERAGSDIFVDVVVFNFVDRLGVVSPLTFTRADLTTLFGSTVVIANASRTFQFTPRFGCGFLSVPSVLNVDLTILNRDGVRHGSSLTASFR